MRRPAIYTGRYEHIVYNYYYDGREDAYKTIINNNIATTIGITCYDSGGVRVDTDGWPITLELIFTAYEINDGRLERYIRGYA